MSRLVCTHRKKIRLKDMKYSSSYGAFIGSKHLPPSQKGYYWVDCGKCLACRMKRKKQWITRLALQMEDTPRAFWSLFTYNNDTVPAFNELGKKRFSAFMKRFRSYVKYHFNWSGIKYFVAGEYGSKNHRPHFHAIIYNLPPCPYGKNCMCIALKYVMERLWKQGYVKTKILEDVSQIYYTCKYAVKGLYDHKGSKPCILFSKGLGKGYVVKNLDKLRKKVRQKFKVEPPCVYVGRYKFNPAICKLFRNYIYGRILELFRCIWYKYECPKYDNDIGLPSDLRRDWEYSKYVEDAVETGNKKLEDIKYVG